MRLVNRPLAFILAAALIAVCVVIIAEVIGFAAHRSPLLVHWTTWYHWGLKTRWDALVVRVWSAILIIVGALILALELKPRRVIRLPLRSGDDATDAALVEDRGGTVVDRDFPAASGEEHRVVRQADDVATGEDLLDRVFDGLPGRLVDDGKDLDEVLAAGLPDGPAGEGLGDRIQEEHAAPVIGGDDGIADALQGGREPAFIEGQSRGRFVHGPSVPTASGD